jgi:hypothetical protein
MNHNPHDSTASIADTPGQLLPRPRAVTIALALLWISLASLVITSIIGAIEAPFVPTTAIVVGIARPLLWLWIIIGIAEGRNWARIMLIVFVCFSIISLVTLSMLFPSSLNYLLTVAWNAIDIAPLILLFTPSARAWFSARRAA